MYFILFSLQAGVNCLLWPSLHKKQSCASVKIFQPFNQHVFFHLHFPSVLFGLSILPKKKKQPNILKFMKFLQNGHKESALTEKSVKKNVVVTLSQNAKNCF